MKNVAVIGASLAGASLAALLGRKKIPVLLFDSRRLPERKPCGEGLSAAGLGVLQRLNLLHCNPISLGSPLSGYRIFNGDKVITINSRGPGGAGIERTLLDHEILKAALKENSVTAFTGERIKMVEKRNSFILHSENGEHEAGYIVYACGSGSPLLSAVPRRGRESKRFGISSVWEGNFIREMQHVNIFLFKGFEIYLTPLGKNRINASILGSKTELAAPLNRKRAMAVLEGALRTAGFTGNPVSLPAGRSFTGNARSPAVFGGAFLAGDACEEFDAAGGMGMTHALLSASILAGKLESMILHGCPGLSAMQSYEREREIMARPLRGFTRAVCFSLLSPGRPAFRAKRIYQAAGPLFNGALNPKRSWAESISRGALSLIGACAR